MSFRSATIKLLILLFVLIRFGTSFAEDPAVPAVGAAVTVNADLIKARLKEIEAATELDEKTKNALTELYRKALSNLETQGAHQDAAKSFAEARKTSPDQAKATLDKLERAKKASPTVTLPVSEKTPLADVEQLLLSEKANQTAVDAKLAGLEEQLKNETERPNAARNRITEIRPILDQLAGELSKQPPPEELPTLTEARRWSQKSRWLALSSEIKMLDQELLSQPMRVELLKAKRDETAYNLQRISTRVKMLEELVSQKRVAQAEQARAEAEETISETVGKHPLIQQLAEQNATLSDQLSSVSKELEQVTSGDERAVKLAKRIEDDYSSAQQKLEVAGMSQALGRVLIEQRRLLPDVRAISKQIRTRERLVAENALRQIQHNEESRRLRNIPDYIDQLTEGLPPEEIEQIRGDLTELAVKRRELLDKAIATDEAYLRALGEIDFAQRRLIDAVNTYDTFLAERLLWIRSSPPINLASILAVPKQVLQLLSPIEWLDVVRILLSQSTSSPVPVLALLLFGVLMWKREKIKAALLASGKKVIKPRTDRFAYTLQALLLTLLLAIRWPLLMAAAGWVLQASLETTELSKALSRALILVTPAYFYLSAFRILCMPGGVADVHFRWPKSSLPALRRRLSVLMVTFLPAGFLAALATGIHTPEFEGALGSLAFVATMISLSVFFFQLFGTNQKLLREMMADNPNSVLVRFRHLWLGLALVLPILLVVLALSGFLYTAGTLTGSLIDTLWLILGFIVVHQLAVRWLLMTRRKIAFEAAVERRRAAQAAEGTKEATTAGSEAGAPPVVEPEIDLIALNDESRKLLNTVIPFTAILGLWFIWSDVLPAFGLLDRISLWHQTAVVSGEQQLVPVTLADVLLALLIGLVTIVATKRFPAVLEIALLRRLSVSSGGRYAAITLARYTIAAIGMVLALSTIGGSWSQIQWLVAALGVGIGFGLQEIVANFISGIIILFERPIRVGDVVTVGDTDGTVTRIQIRATTIRTWDRQELLVPNKEFITGRLLNWSLSDQTTRIKIPVGIAYGSDVKKAMSLMNEVAEENEKVLADPPPSIIFSAFGDNSLNLVLRCFVGVQDDRMPTMTALHEAINRKFNEAGIVISFPQRDVHLDTSRPLDVRIRHDQDDSSPNRDGVDPA